MWSVAKEVIACDVANGTYCTTCGNITTGDVSTHTVYTCDKHASGCKYSHVRNTTHCNIGIAACGLYVNLSVAILYAIAQDIAAECGITGHS